MVIKYFQWSKNRPNGHKRSQDFPLQDPPKFTQSGIFGLKTNHLATLCGMRFSSSFFSKVFSDWRRACGATNHE
jgi:hypothetical protein